MGQPRQAELTADEFIAWALEQPTGRFELDNGVVVAMAPERASHAVAKLNAVIEHDAQFYKIIRDVLVAHLHGNAAQVSVEIGRGSVPSSLQPSFAQLEEALAAAAEA